MNTASYLFAIPHKSKARPRSTMGKAKPYMDNKYKTWHQNMRALMAEWWTLSPLAEVSVVYMKFAGPERGDLDNRCGAVLDAGNGLIWADDSVRVIRSLALKWEKAPIKEQTIHLSIHWP